LTEVVIENHEAGLLYVEGRLVERLAPGRHCPYFRASVTVPEGWQEDSRIASG
jgi:hypothetical protein